MTAYYWILAIVTLVILPFSIFGLEDKESAARILNQEGYTNVTVGGTNSFSCGRDDLYRTAFTATNLNGVEVSGTVCSGWLFKGHTIRFD